MENFSASIPKALLFAKYLRSEGTRVHVPKAGRSDLVQYDQEFNKLMRFGPGQVSTEKDRIKKFRNGMKFSLQTALSTHKFKTYNDLLDTALTLERAQKQQEEYRNRDNKKRPFNG